MTAAAPSPLARIRADVQSMHAYAVQDSSGLLKMDAMENPHRPPQPGPQGTPMPKPQVTVTPAPQPAPKPAPISPK